MDDGISLLDALRDELGCRSVKDGCSPQGQCGCCTVWVDGAPRVACVTPIRRVAGRAVTTLEGLSEEQSARWSEAFVAHGASQCGFCTPGIVMRLAALEDGGAGGRGRAAKDSSSELRRDVEAGLRAHLCRCTGWQSIIEAAVAALGQVTDPAALLTATSDAEARDPLLAAWRAQLEGPAYQSSGPDVVLGGGGFADDSAPPDAHLQLGADAPLAPDIRAAREGTARVQGRNSTLALSHPVRPPKGDWALTLQTTWVEPAYVEPDASWCRPGDQPASPLANGGAFGGKRTSPVPNQAQALADEQAEPVRVLWRREDVVRRGPKRPPLGLALRLDGSGVVRFGRTPGSADLGSLAEQVELLAPGLHVEQVDITGPPVGPELRGAGWAEVLASLHALKALSTDRAQPDAPPPLLSEGGTGRADVTVPGAGRAVVEFHPNEGERGRLAVEVWAGTVLCPVTLRSYALGAVHQALGLVWSEGIAVDETGEPVDLTIRSFGILAARDMPDVVVTLHEEDDGWPVNGSDAVFVATLAAAWIAEGLPPAWPTRRAVVRAPRRDVAPSGRQEEAV